MKGKTISPFTHIGTFNTSIIYIQELTKIFKCVPKDKNMYIFYEQVICERVTRTVKSLEFFWWILCFNEARDNVHH